MMNYKEIKEKGGEMGGKKAEGNKMKYRTANSNCSRCKGRRDGNGSA